MRVRSGARLGATAVVAALAIISLLVSAGAETKKQYWATSLTGSVDGGLLRGLREAVGRGDVGWLDVDPEIAVEARAPGINLIFYHVGGNCYIGSDCERFPASRPTGDQWGDTERTNDLGCGMARAWAINRNAAKQIHRPPICSKPNSFAPSINPDGEDPSARKARSRAGYFASNVW